MFDKLVVVTLKTRLEELVERFNTREQAKFYIEHMGLNFAEYDREHEIYTDGGAAAAPAAGRTAAQDAVHRTRLPAQLPLHAAGLVVTIGRDGLVVNTAKYLDGQPIVAVNPDPARIDGILLPFTPHKASAGRRPRPGGEGQRITRSRWPRSTSTTANSCWRSTTSTSASGRTCRRATA